MNQVEHLLACLSEECAEVQHAVGKALRFGLHDMWPEKGVTNSQQITIELLDVQAISILLYEHEALKRMGPQAEGTHVLKKRSRVLQLIDYARVRGIVSGD